MFAHLSARPPPDRTPRIGPRESDPLGSGPHCVAHSARLPRLQPLGSASICSAPFGSVPLGSDLLCSALLGVDPLASAPFGTVPRLGPLGSVTLGAARPNLIYDLSKARPLLALRISAAPVFGRFGPGPLQPSAAPVSGHSAALVPTCLELGAFRRSAAQWVSGAQLGTPRSAPLLGRSGPQRLVPPQLCLRLRSLAALVLARSGTRFCSSFDRFGPSTWPLRDSTLD